MPELPDVETLRRYLDATSLHQRISDVRVLNTKVLRGISGKRLAAKLRGRRFESTARRGKNLFVEMDDGSWLRLHFGMSGFLVYSKAKKELHEHCRAVIEFGNGSRLEYVCQRMFGEISAGKGPEEFSNAEDLGPDALDLSFQDFAGALEGRKGALKPVLMNQAVIAGLGNVYVDEILFQAGLDPTGSVTELSKDEVRTLHRTMQRVLKVTVRHQADPSRFPKTYLTPRREEGAECPRCGAKIEKTTVSQRGTYWCPACQG